jgi:hypothetical protein
VSENGPNGSETEEGAPEVHAREGIGSPRRYGVGEAVEVQGLEATGSYEPQKAKQKHDLIVFDRSQRSLRQPGDRPEAPLASLGLTRPPPVAPGKSARPRRPPGWAWWVAVGPHRNGQPARHLFAAARVAVEVRGQDLDQLGVSILDPLKLPNLPIGRPGVAGGFTSESRRFHLHPATPPFAVGGSLISVALAVDAIPVLSTSHDANLYDFGQATALGCALAPTHAPDGAIGRTAKLLNPPLVVTPQCPKIAPLLQSWRGFPPDPAGTAPGDGGGLHTLQAAHMRATGEAQRRAVAARYEYDPT